MTDSIYKKIEKIFIVNAPGTAPVYIYIGYSIAGGNIAELSYQLESDEGNKRVCGI